MAVTTAGTAACTCACASACARHCFLPGFLLLALRCPTGLLSLRPLLADSVIGLPVRTVSDDIVFPPLPLSVALAAHFFPPLGFRCWAPSCLSLLSVESGGGYFGCEGKMWSNLAASHGGAQGRPPFEYVGGAGYPRWWIGSEKSQCLHSRQQ